jgi:hypothetical protein
MRGVAAHLKARGDARELSTRSRRGSERRQEVPEYPVPSGSIILASVASLRILFPSAVLQFDAGSVSFRGKVNLDLRGNLPTGRPPGESNQ